MVAIIIFIALAVGSSVFFAINVKKIRRNINLGKDFTPEGDKSQRLGTMLRVAFGQSKMVSRPLPALMHFFVYVGFVLINIEVLEMVIDGATGNHRTFHFLGGYYNFLIAFFEILALLVFIGVVVFWLRRNVAKVKRLAMGELNGFPKFDANAILIAEILMMSALMIMNAADQQLQKIPGSGYHTVGSFPISGFLAPLFEGLSPKTLIIMERGAWWFHIVGIFAFLNYLPYSCVS
jgi:hypothetical protein